MQFFSQAAGLTDIEALVEFGHVVGQMRALWARLKNADDPNLRAYADRVSPLVFADEMPAKFGDSTAWKLPPIHIGDVP